MRSHRVRKENLELVLALLRQSGIEAQECPPPSLQGDLDFPRQRVDSWPMAGVKCPLSGMEFHRFLVHYGVVSPWSRHDKKDQKRHPLFDPTAPLASTYEGLLTLNRELDSALEAESPC